MCIFAFPTLLLSAALRAAPVRGLHIAAQEPPRPAEEDQRRGDAPAEEDDFHVSLRPEEASRPPRQRRQSASSLLCASPSKSALEGRLRRCRACALHPEAKQRLFIHEGSDGIGSRILSIMGGMSWADSWNMSFGGVVLRSGCEVSHGEAVLPVVRDFFGLDDPEEMYVSSLPDDDRVAQYHHVRDMEEALRQGDAQVASAPVLFHHCAIEPQENVNKLGISPRLLTALRNRDTPLQQLPLQRFRRGATSVAIHVRRGDVFASVPGRGTRDEWYLQLMDVVRSLLPGAEFHIFSSRERRHGNAEFDVYREWGATVHLDTELRDTLAHMARAQVLITAMSSFSYVAAVLNSNCVLSQHWFRPLPEWVGMPSVDTCGHGAESCDYGFNDTWHLPQIERCVRSHGKPGDREEEQEAAQPRAESGA